MVILGLGTNLGDRLANLRAAIAELKKISAITIQQISPVYLSDAMLPDNAESDWNQPYFNLAIRCDTTLDPMELLHIVKNIEAAIGRIPLKRHWGPRIIDIDILAWDDIIIENEKLTIPHAHLQERPFALWPLADVAPFWICPTLGETQGKTAAQLVEKWPSRFDGNAPFHTHQIYQRVDMPRLMGVVNVTPDSFSDGGNYFSVDDAFKQVIALLEAGAEIIDIGAESTSPSATPLDPDTEWQRLEPLLKMIAEYRHTFIMNAIISIDTRHVEVARKSLAYGVDWINDVSGLDDPAMRRLIAENNVQCVVMHHLSIPECRQHHLPRNQDPVQTVLDWGKKRLAELELEGISKDKIIFDPGIGFGKMAEQSLELLKHAHVFKQLGTRVLIGHSRKSFMSMVSGLPFAERDIETMAMSLKLAQQDIDFLRVHNVEMCARGLRVLGVIQ